MAEIVLLLLVEHLQQEAKKMKGMRGSLMLKSKSEVAQHTFVRARLSVVLKSLETKPAA